MARNSCTNFPDIAIDQGWGILEVLSTGTDGFLQRLSISKSAEYSPPLYERMYNGSNWTKWGQIALATPPQEFVLPLADNWTTQQASTYFKTQEGIVVARIAIKSTAEYTSGGLLFTLPEGFRPSENVEFPCTIKRADNLQASSIYFRTSGAASENHSGGAVLPVGTELYTLAVFIAAS